MKSRHFNFWIIGTVWTLIILSIVTFVLVEQSGSASTTWTERGVTVTEVTYKIDRTPIYKPAFAIPTIVILFLGWYCAWRACSKESKI